MKRLEWFLLTITWASLAVLPDVAAAQTHYVAYGYDSNNNLRPLPENIDDFEAKDLVRIEWGHYSGHKIRVAVLEVQNTIKAMSASTGDSSITALSAPKPKHDATAVPVDNIEAILTDALHRSGRFRVVEHVAPNKQPTPNTSGAQFQIQAVITSYEPNYEVHDAATPAGWLKKLAKTVDLESSRSMVAMNFRIIDSTTSEVKFTTQVKSVMSSGWDWNLRDTAIANGEANTVASKHGKTLIDHAVIAAINKGVFELVKQIGPAPPPSGLVIAITDTKVHSNLGEGAVKVGDELKAYSVGEKLIDPETREVLGTYDVELGPLKVTQVNGKTSTMEPIGFPATKLKTGDRVKSIKTSGPLEFGQSWDERLSGAN